jgi:hypothetical protein
MSAWRREALKLLPEHRSTINEASGPMALWIELLLNFEDAVKNDDTSRVERILRFAAWCTSEHSGSLPNDISTAVHCAFYEHLPQHREFWPQMRKWFGPHEFAALLPTFGYHVSEKELAELKKQYEKTVA